MRASIAIILSLLPGCFYFGREQDADVLQKPSVEWSNRDVLTVLISSTAHNLHDPDHPTLKVFATPYYPSVIVAIARARQRALHQNQAQYQMYADALAKDDLGMYIDWNKDEFVDARGNYFRDPLQLNSLMFLVTLQNWGWPFPEISHLENDIYLANDSAKYVLPTFVWGRRHNYLIVDETLFIMFQLRKGDHHFLDGSENMYLVIKGFEKDIKLTFPLSMIR